MDGILYVLPWLNSTDLIEEPSAGSEGEVLIFHSGKKVGKLGLVLVGESIVDLKLLYKFLHLNFSAEYCSPLLQ